MSADPIQVQVTDNVASSVATKLLAIADAANKGADSVEKLQAMLDNIDASGVNKLVKAQADLESQTAKNNLAYLAQETALNKAIAAESNAALAAQKLSDAQTKAASATAKVAAAAEAATNTVNAFGETEADVAARIAQVSAAAIANQKAMQGVNLTGVDVITTEQRLAKATADAGTSARKAAEDFSNYRSMLANVGKTPAAAASATPGIDPAKTAAGTKSLNDQATATAGVTRELIVLGHEALTGNFSRMPGSLLVLAERASSLQQVFASLALLANPILIGFGAIVGIVVGLTKALSDADEEARQFQATLDLTGNAAGLTQKAFTDSATGIAAANNASISSTKALEQQLAATGTLNANEIAQLTDGITKLSKSTGESTTKIVGSFKTIATAPQNFADEMQKAFGITIDSAIQAQIDALQRHGETAKAAQLAIQAFSEYMNDHTAPALTGIAGLLDRASTKFSNFWTNVKQGLSGQGIDPLADAKANLSDIIKLQQDAASSGNTDLASQYQASADVLKEQIQLLGQIAGSQQGAATAAADRVKSEQAGSIAIKSEIALADSYKSTWQKANDEIDKVRANIAAIQSSTVGGTKEGQDAVAGQQALIDAIRKRAQGAAPKATDDETREAILAKVNGDLAKQLDYYGQINTVREAGQKLDAINNQLATHKKNGRLNPLPPLTDDESSGLKSQLTDIANNKLLSQSLDAIYTSVIGPQKAYEAQTLAVQLLEKDGVISKEQVTAAQLKVNDTYAAATDPLFTYNKNLADQTALLSTNLTAQQRVAEAQVQAQNNQLRAQGKPQLTDDQAQHIRDTSIAQQQLNQYVQTYVGISEANNNAQVKVLNTQNALNESLAKGTISQDQYTAATVQNALAANQLALDAGTGFADMSNVALGAFGKLATGFKSVFSGLSDSFGSFFTTLDDGFANSVGKAIVMGGSLKDSLVSVAQQGIEGLIASLIKLGIQYVVNAALGKSIQTTALATSTATSVTAAATTALAWAPAAAAVSLASFGANSIPADAGIASTYALTDALSALSGFQNGGYTGNLPTNNIAGVVHGQEFVVNAAATRANMATLQAMNSGKSVGSSAAALKVNIQNFGTSKDYEVVPVSRDEVTLIARDEAVAAVQKHAPTVVAADLNNPNSKMSKAQQQNFAVSRNRR